MSLWAAVPKEQKEEEIGFVFLRFPSIDYGEELPADTYAVFAFSIRPVWACGMDRGVVCWGSDLRASEGPTGRRSS